jgi:hypothetical protein
MSIPDIDGLYANLRPVASGAGPEDVILTVGRLDVRNFNGAYIETNCSIRSAVLEYDMTLKNHDLSFDAPPSAGRVIALANNTYLNTSANNTQPLTWVGLQTYCKYADGKIPLRDLINPSADLHIRECVM